MTLDATLFNVLIQGGFGALFVWLLIDTRKDSRDREAKLTEHLDKYYNTLPLIVETLTKMEARLERIEDDIRAAAKPTAKP